MERSKPDPSMPEESKAHASDYIVVLNARSDARFADGEGLLVSHFPTPVGDADFRFLTRFEERGLETVVPNGLWVEVSGTSNAPLQEAMEAYANTALGFLPLIVVSANAWIDDVQIDLAFDNTRERNEREFFQRFSTALEPDAVRFGRRVDRDATFALIVAIANHGEAERLRRAAEQYRQALANWLNGHEVLASAHLWIAVEALTKVGLRRACEHEDTSAPELAEKWGVRLQELDGEIRRRLIFQNDVATARKAREASDGLEHAYLGFGALRGLAAETRDATAGYVREAILEFADLDEPWRERLLKNTYGKPLRSWIEKYLRGTFIGAADDLAAPDQAYPIFFHRHELKQATAEPDGTYKIQMEETLRGSFNEQLSFQGTSFEVWGAREEVVSAVGDAKVVTERNSIP
jgi:hypothetical protein